MIINYLNGADLPIENLTPDETKAYIENWCKTNWVKEEVCWVSPLDNENIIFGGLEPDWREIYNG